MKAVLRLPAAFTLASGALCVSSARPQATGPGGDVDAAAASQVEVVTVTAHRRE